MVVPLGSRPVVTVKRYDSVFREIVRNIEERGSHFMGHASLIGYASVGAFASQAYLDEYWCLIFLSEAAPRLVAREPSATKARLAAQRGVTTPIKGTASGQTATPVAASPSSTLARDLTI
jgi:class 3 adenylate cyclase